MNVFDELMAREMIAQTTGEEEIRKALGEKQVTFYIGFDPTADSLHVGHFLQLMVMARMQRAGHRPIAIVGGGTGMIGDPSGKTDMRKMLTPEIINHNIECFKKQMKNFVDFSDGKALIVNNADWLMDLNYVEFLREVGVHFSVNKMLTAECFKRRLEKGLTFLEFNYMLMQSYDFYRLHTDYGCTMELGGDDQWSNILGGIELCRRKAGHEVYGMTFKLLTTSEGVKMGKTEKGAVWLDPEKTSPYEFFQYWRNIGDKDVIKCMKLLTFMSLEEIAEYKAMEGTNDINKAKERLAYELTKLVHGEDNAKASLESARALFADGGSKENMPKTELEASDFEGDNISIVNILVKSGLAPSNGEAKRLIKQGGVSVNGEKCSDMGAVFAKSDFENEFIVKKGKKDFRLIVLK